MHHARRCVLLLMVLVASVVAEAQEVGGYQVIKGFSSVGFPQAGLVRGSDGNLYGTSGGVGGTVFRISADGSSFSIIHRFDVADGSNPRASLVEGLDGAFYGTTYEGGAFNYGTVFRVTPDGSSFSVLHSFDGFSAAWPAAGLVQGSDGAFYGTTRAGGPPGGFGTVFRITADGSSFSILHGFSGGDGNTPEAGLVQGSDGDFYGTTTQGVFRLAADGSSFSLLHRFAGTDGSYSCASLVQGSDGAFYGTTREGGASNYGTVFRVTADGSSFSVLHAFDGANGYYSHAGLVQGSDGAFYGTTQWGGVSVFGTVFRVTADGSSFSLLHSFNIINGANPLAGLVLGSDGAFYGTTSAGGASNFGSVFKVSADGSSFSVLHSFDGGNGFRPQAGLVQGSDGALYGTTSSGGASNHGSVFRVAADGSSYSVLHSFDGSNGPENLASLVQGSDGALYGTTSQGGAYGPGSLFKVATDGSAYAVIHSFDGASGSMPLAGLVEGSDGAFYGTTYVGGAANLGTVFRAAADGSFFSVLHSFDGANGSKPMAALVQGSDGAFYGTTYWGGVNDLGTVFRITADGSSFSVLRSFDGSNGAFPSAGLVRGPDGALYGTTWTGGMSGAGTVYRVAADGSSLSVLHSFDRSDGFGPQAGLVQGSDGAFYGTTTWGGASTLGTIFRITAHGSFSVLKRLNPWTDGASPRAGLVQGSDGAFYGTTPYGGPFGGGVVLRLIAGIHFSRPAFMTSDPGSSVVLSVSAPRSLKAATVDYTTNDGTATAGIDYVATAGQLSFAPGVTTRTLSVTLVSNATYHGDRAFLVTLSNPAGAPLGVQRTAVVAIKDRNPVPTLQFSVREYSATEGGPGARITVVRSGLTSVPVTVSFATVDGTATAPGDYTSSAGTLSFAAGGTSQTFSVAITDDQIPEPAEYLDLVLSSPGGGAILGPRRKATLRINDNDQAVQFASAVYTISEASFNAIIGVKRTGGASGTLTVNYATGTGTATAGSDYQATSGTLTFGPGIVTRTFAVPIMDDTLDEGSETIPLTLSNPNPATALGSPSTATLTILDNEAVVQFSAAKYVAAEPVGTRSRNATVTVRRLGSLLGTVHVDYATSPGMAVPGFDYADTTGQLTFGPGVPSQTFPVTLLGNSSDAPNPTVNLTLTRVDVPLGTPSTAVLTIADNDVAGTAQLSAVAFSGLGSTGRVPITIQRTGGAAVASVQYATSDGTAIDGADYTATTGTVTFDVGETTKFFTVPVAVTGPPNRYFLVTLGPTTGSLGLGPVTQAPVWIVE